MKLTSRRLMGRAPKVLILDGMWNKSLAAVRSLGAKGFKVTIGERTRLATALFSKYASRVITYPSPARRPADFLDQIIREIAGAGYDTVFPMEWTTQQLLTEPVNRQKLQRHTRIPFADVELARFVNDKDQLLKFAREHGIDMPETYSVKDMDELGKLAAAIGYPVVIKPRVSSGSRGLAYIADRQILLNTYSKIHASYSAPLIQEFIPGNEIYGVGILLNFRSQVRASFVYRRIRSYPVEGGPSTLRVSVKRDDLADIAGHLLSSLKWTGVAHVEFKIDPRDGKPRLLEVNPRFWGSLALAIEAGVDFPYLLFKLAMDGDIEEVREYKEGVMTRWLIPGDLLHFIKNPGRFRMRPGFFDFSIKDDIISLHDPLPTLGRLLSAFTIVSDGEMRALMKR